MNPAFWSGKRVFLTGHTGFKGSWLALILQTLGARVRGYALDPPTDPSLFVAAGVAREMEHRIGDVRDAGALEAALSEEHPEIVFHLAAQPIVRLSYEEPVATFATNIMGSVHVLEAVRKTPSVRSLVVVTSDKCYENNEWLWGYRENEPLGGRDPYSSSKACAELVVAAYRESFFAGDDLERTITAVATARAGNVIGGGDWARDRIVSDAVRAFASGEIMVVRSPQSIRPWQHVLDPLSGYLLLAEKLWTDRVRYAGSWNFGPLDSDARPVAWLVGRLADLWGGAPRWEQRPVGGPHEATYLRLDCTKARSLLGWAPRLRLDEAMRWLVPWYRTFYDGGDVRRATLEQIERYLALPAVE